jgi:hypothetical protein
MPSTGGPAQTIATVAGGGTRGFAWNTRDRLAFGVNTPGVGLIQVAATGATTDLFKPDPERRAIYPDMLPDGKGVLFTLTDSPTDPGELHALLFDTSETKKVLADATHARVLPTGHLVFMRSGSLWAVPFDTGRLETKGTAMPVIEGVRMESGGTIQYDL